MSVLSVNSWEPHHLKLPGSKIGDRFEAVKSLNLLPKTLLLASMFLMWNQLILVNTSAGQSMKLEVTTVSVLSSLKVLYTHILLKVSSPFLLKR